MALLEVETTAAAAASAGREMAAVVAAMPPWQLQMVMCLLFRGPDWPWQLRGPSPHPQKLRHGLPSSTS
jgi:hypothetical protein